MTKVRIGLLGAGKRVHTMYAPVLQRMENVTVAGFWNRDAVKKQKLIDAFGYRHYSDPVALAKDVDAILVVVNSSALTEVTMSSLALNRPLLAETPVWTKEVVQAASVRGMSLAIAEQTPFLPSEQFKMELLKHRDVVGVPHTVVNDHRTFEYHGFAQLRRYIGFDKTPVEVCGMSHSTPMFPFKDGNGVEQRGHIENWDSGQVRFATGEVAVYNFSSLYNRCPYRKPRSLRIYTDRASISNDDNEFEIWAGDEDATSWSIPTICRVDPSSRKTLSLEARLDGPRSLSTHPGIVVKWAASDPELNDQQEALKVVIDNFVKHVSDGVELLYDAKQGWVDFNLLMALRHCSSSRSYVVR